MFTYPLFNSFPAEIHALILEQCPPNDRTCLRLTCKSLYTLSPPKYPVSLDYSPKPEIFCTKPEVQHITGGSKPSFPIRKCSFGIQICHDRSLAYINTIRASEGIPPLSKKKCRDHWGDHCSCFDRSGILYKQLRTWVPKNMKYCSECGVFTKRMKSKKGRCTHGLPKFRYRRNAHITHNLWTNHKGRGGYYHKLWNKWFNNSAWDRMEARLRGKRKVNKRYNLRGYKPRVLDSSWMRREGGGSGPEDYARYARYARGDESGDEEDEEDDD